jgi:spermidine dehydrogenase
MFGHLGFDAERDIEAITVNRWSHGYTYEYNRLFDPEWEEGQAPHELGRAPIGRISIANSDSEAYAYLQSAIDAAERAVNEMQG